MAAFASFSEDNKSYESWAVEDLGITNTYGLQVKEVQYMTGNERGLFTDVDIQANSTLISVPLAALITKRVALDSEVKAMLSNMREDDVLSLFLLHERAKGELSHWYQHIKLLPEATHSVLMWADDDVQELQGFDNF